ncbi:DNA photolyase family protein [Streptomyces sp. GMY02]|uniref:cryptochrome/photolyase family protein n=1 Tax=Streptomyces sp. GMY02 TaxID=1333528 RepID=UPI001C2C3255|nr:deoxyribodipyrimidine photo-lyase [Streptomyces sp. GMY02]QXE35997.1 DNA photolyase family protein [Streptomyces sp. GMY02]
MRVSVALFTQDLRVHDNPVLRAALREAERVVPLFVVDAGIRRTGFAVPNRAAFLADSLADLDAALRARGGRLVVRTGDVVEETCRVVTETGAGTVHVAGGASRYATRREDRLRAALTGDRCGLRIHDASVTTVPPGALVPGGKDHFAVFTPYFRRWEGFSVRGVLPAPARVPVADVRSAALPDAESLAPGSVSPGLPAGGEPEGRRRLRSWLAGPLERYADLHDDLAADATSRLSPYLHFGCLSPVELLERAREHGGPGAHAFVRQLAWRDFHHQVLAARPDAAHHDYRPRHDRWRRNAEETGAWREGRTGYPVVDAAMRQLRHEGWMPGRARLLAASFLTKTLYVDWRVGAEHFLGLLVDGDVANNQLNWQWAAGTGTDTRPNRILNPLVQARRFDPGGEYVRHWLPELRDLDAASIHRLARPGEAARTGRRTGTDYPAPIVDLAEAADRFKRLRNGD